MGQEYCSNANRKSVFNSSCFTTVEGAASVILSFVRTIKPKRLKLKSPNLAQGYYTMIPRPPINIRSKGQRSRSQGHKVQKGDRVAGVSDLSSDIDLSIECPASSFLRTLNR